MATLQFPSAQHNFEAGHPDLESAFNDGYRLSDESLGTQLGRWALIAWSVAAWCIGSLFLGSAFFAGASHLWRLLKHTAQCLASQWFDGRVSTTCLDDCPRTDCPSCRVAAAGQRAD